MGQKVRHASLQTAEGVHGAKAMSNDDTSPESLETGAIQAKLEGLRIEHRDLDDVISRLSMDFKVDELQMKRLKKRKLMLKDQIARLESQLIPDLNA